MFEKLFKTRTNKDTLEKSTNHIDKTDIQVTSPLEGELLPISDVPDEVFSQKMMGDGFAINPKNGIVTAPVNGKIVNAFPTKHAIGIEAENGLEVLIHVGVDTVNLKGEGFETFIKEGQTVKQGEKLLTVDLEFVKDKVPSVITPVIFTNLEGKEVTLLKNGMVSNGEKDIISFN